MLAVPVTASRQLQAAVLAMKAADREVQKVIRKDTADTFRDEWRDGVRRSASGGQQGRARSRMLRAGVNFTGGNPPTATAYMSTRALRGGLVPAVQYGPMEFGANASQRAKKTTYTRTSPKGTRHKVTRRTRAQLPPYFQAAGYSVYPNVARIAPRVVSYWVQSIVRAYARAAEGLAP